MENISIKFDMLGLEISTDNRLKLTRIIDDALKDSGCGQWTGCQFTKETITIHAMVEDEEQASRAIRSAIKGHPVFSYMGYHENSCANAR